MHAKIRDDQNHKNQKFPTRELSLTLHPVNKNKTLREITMDIHQCQSHWFNGINVIPVPGAQYPETLNNKDSKTIMMAMTIFNDFFILKVCNYGFLDSSLRQFKTRWSKNNKLTLLLSAFSKIAHILQICVSHFMTLY